MSRRKLTAFLAELLKNPEILPYTNLYLELASVAIQEGEPYRDVAGWILSLFLEWVKANLDAVDPRERDQASAFTLTFVEGLVLLNAVGEREAASQALSWVMREDRSDGSRARKPGNKRSQGR